MDLVLNFADYYVFSPYVYPSSWPEDGALRQIISLLVLTNIGASILYLGLGSFSYFFIYDHRLMKHPQFLPNQVHREIKYTMSSLPWISIPTVALFFLEVRGYSKLYDSVSESALGWPGFFLSLVSFLFFTDMCIYWIHRFLHHKRIYKLFHKPHHIWKIPTPFASHAFHPVDGFMQGLPYHIYPFIFPLHKVLYLALYIFVNIWTISIHDGSYHVPGPLASLINGSAHHTDHHLFFDYNYGQYFTLWDHLGGSYRYPSALMGKGPYDLIQKLEAEGKLTTNGSLYKDE
ncbi:lathosterol oxidase-like [Thalassophryne amazonica]|uniref:lathosterol oxidase-like n=1 Tax=Thalassophryne amazonica TaxID=390379 RepID=UPI001472308B|nr:lathosterol oxidase-like [Thalassophryne amazonica]